MEFFFFCMIAIVMYLIVLMNLPIVLEVILAIIIGTFFGVVRAIWDNDKGGDS